MARPSYFLFLLFGGSLGIVNGEVLLLCYINNPVVESFIGGYSGRLESYLMHHILTKFSSSGARQDRFELQYTEMG